jgi:hypothetical protein
MQTLSAIQSRYDAIAALTATTRKSASSTDSSTNSTTAASAQRDGTQVSISAAGRAAAASEKSAASEMAVHRDYRLPDNVRAWFTKDFSADVLAEAKTRLQAIRENGELGMSGPANLPLLPENQALIDSFKAEMGELAANGHANMTEEQSGRYNLLMNLSLRVAMTGWQKPMSEADAQREFDIGNAMAKLANEDPSLRPPESSATATSPESSVRSPDEMIADIQSGKPPAVWRERWDAAGLTMPTNTDLSPDRSMWLSLAEAAGIGEDEFMTHMRSLASNMQGHALTRAMETFISERYVALRDAQQTGAV